MDQFVRAAFHHFRFSSTSTEITICQRSTKLNCLLANLDYIRLRVAFLKNLKWKQGSVGTN